MSRTTAGAGYICGCGMWVAYGTTHSCGQARNWQNPPIPVDPTLARIAGSLERIAKALERQYDDSHVSAPPP